MRIRSIRADTPGGLTNRIRSGSCLSMGANKIEEYQ